MIRRAAAETLGTALLLAIVVGSGIMGERLAEGNAAVALLANSLATGAGLFVLITVFAPISGAHFNPAVTLASTIARATTPKEAVAYILAQLAGACAGVAVRTQCSAYRCCKLACVNARLPANGSEKASPLSVWF